VGQGVARFVPDMGVLVKNLQIRLNCHSGTSGSKYYHRSDSVRQKQLALGDENEQPRPEYDHEGTRYTLREL